ncbi:MAG TPA: SDR family oxidoreductase [Gemmatimonadaceae bacterium]|nr:SDR family oxidoreductase [Gemmatimonadaceae bacterium]
MRLKPIQDQVVVVIGASSGIGREVALQFAAHGAKVVVAARGEPGLVSLVETINSTGGAAIHVVCDVTRDDEVAAVADAAVRAYGRIDTWVNAAAVSVYARFEDTSADEFRRVMDVTFMGQVNGARAALPHLRREGRGALIAISSVESRVGMPLHTSYSAAKHAIEGFLDSLRRELLHDGVQVSVTSIKPTTINTPFFDNARTKMGVKPQGPPPRYQPNVVADCVLYAAHTPIRELYAGGGGRMMELGQTLAPSMMDRVVSRVAMKAQQTEEPKELGAPDNLFAPRTEETRVQGDFSTTSRSSSVYTWLETHPRARTLLAAGVLGTAAMVLAQRGGNSAPRR